MRRCHRLVRRCLHRNVGDPPFHTQHCLRVNPPGQSSLTAFWLASNRSPNRSICGPSKFFPEPWNASFRSIMSTPNRISRGARVRGTVTSYESTTTAIFDFPSRLNIFVSLRNVRPPKIGGDNERADSSLSLCEDDKRRCFCKASKFSLMP